MEQRGTLINTAQEALEYLIESWDIVDKAAAEHEIEAILHKYVGDPYPIDTSSLRKQLKELSNEQIGFRFSEFVAEANHGSWDGWDSDDTRRVVEQVMYDIALWLENYGS